MTDQILVLAADAADHQLINDWRLHNLALDHSQELETKAWHYDQPHTTEVWPTIATGEPPSESGINKERSVKWENSGVNSASAVARRILPSRARTALGELLLDIGQETTPSVPTTDSEHVFDTLIEWPGLTSQPRLLDYWEVTNSATERTHTDIWSTVWEYARADIGRATTHDGLVGVHVHPLDVAGHLYADDSDRLRDFYEEMDTLVGHLRDQVDELILISDHGMQVSWLDESPGDHSWRAHVAATSGIEALPQSILGAAEWLRGHQPTDTRSEGGSLLTSPATTDDRLEALGYK